ncbi:MAG: class I SAM-dependent methyltransferase [Actinobacteria bacterium]|nr:class I SAM-dependent methyltransferase [Actinomycetota bacterium]
MSKSSYAAGALLEAEDVPQPPANELTAVRRPVAVGRLPGTRRSSPSYCVRAPLSRWLAERAATLASNGSSRVLDFGCGDRRYEPVFARVGAAYVGFDAPWNPLADVTGAPDAVPVADASFDIVVCTQTLEHLPDPAAAIRELRRIVRPDGHVIASTHGTAVYHPSPTDYWRWTRPGLEKLFTDNAEWSSVDVAPAQGTAATTAMLIATLIDLACKRLHVRPLALPATYFLNVASETLDRAVSTLRQPIPGSLTATFHVEARP